MFGIESRLECGSSLWAIVLWINKVHVGIDICQNK